MPSGVNSTASTDGPEEWKKLASSFKMPEIIVNDEIPDGVAYMVNRRAMRQLQDSAFKFSMPEGVEAVKDLPQVDSPIAVRMHYDCGHVSKPLPAVLVSGDWSGPPISTGSQARQKVIRALRRLRSIVGDGNPVDAMLAKKDREHRERQDQDLAAIPIARIRND